MALSFQEEMESGGALESFMDAFSARRRLPAKFEAQFRMFGDPSYRGSVDFEIRKRGVNDFPVLDCDSDVMRSFGVNYGSFDPKFQRFYFDRLSQELRIAGPSYDFVLVEIKSKRDR